MLPWMTAVTISRFWVKLTSCCNMSGRPSVKGLKSKIFGDFPNIPRYASAENNCLSQGSIIKGQWRSKTTRLGHLAGSSTLGSWRPSTWTSQSSSLKPAQFCDSLSPSTQLHTKAHASSTCISEADSWFCYMKKRVAFFPNEDHRHLGKVGKILKNKKVV